MKLWERKCSDLNENYNLENIPRFKSLSDSDKDLCLELISNCCFIRSSEYRAFATGFSLGRNKVALDVKLIAREALEKMEKK